MRRGVLLVVLAASTWAAPARAGECTTAVVKGDTALSSIDAGVRLRFIREHLRAEARRARIWSWSWAGVYTGLTVGQLAASPALARDSRPDMYIGAGASFLGLAVIAISPLRVMGDEKWLERRLRTAPPGTHECVLLAEAEHLLLRDAKNEAFGVSEMVHVGNVVVNLGVFLAIALGYGHWTSASLSLVIGIAVGEVMIYTQPIGLVEDLRRYRAGDLAPAPPAPRLGLTVAPLAAPGVRGMPRGAALSLVF